AEIPVSLARRTRRTSVARPVRADSNDRANVFVSTVHAAGAVKAPDRDAANRCQFLLASSQVSSSGRAILMIFTPTQLDDARLIDIETKEDERGFFARIWCRQELAAQGLDNDIAQESLSFNRYRGTLRGLHFQRPPHDETKIVRCTRGA